MSKYGYVGRESDAPQQAFRANAGVLNPNDIIDLSNNNKLTQFGQIEFLETQTISDAVADFTTLQETVYDIHFFTFSDIHFGSQTEFGYRLSNDGGTSYETGYDFANFKIVDDGGTSPRKNTNQSTARLFGDIDNGGNSVGQGYMYLYGASNQTKYTTSTSHFVFENASDKFCTEWGGQGYDHTEQISAIRFGASTSMSNITSATISLYGIRSYK